MDGEVAVVDQDSYGFYVTRGEVTYVAACSKETSPLMVKVEFYRSCRRVAGVPGERHRGDPSGTSVTLYQLLDEMLDSGIPVNTHAVG